MKVSVIDIGSNTIKATIFKIQKNCAKSIVDFKAHKAMLISFVFEREGLRYLSDEGEERFYTAFADLIAFSEEQKCEKIFAFATASLRGIANSAMIIANLRERYGVNVEILTGDEEALCSLRGLLSSPDLESTTEGIMIDMGGGSTEVVYFKNGEPPSLVSLSFGCLSLYKDFVKGDLPDNNEEKEIEAFVLRELEKCSFAKKARTALYLIGGSARAVRKLVNAKNRNILRVDGSDFDYVRKSMTDRAFYEKAEKIITGRTTTISPACIAYKTIVEYISPSYIAVSDSGVREGYLEKILP